MMAPGVKRLEHNYSRMIVAQLFHALSAIVYRTLLCKTTWSYTHSFIASKTIHNTVILVKRIKAHYKEMVLAGKRPTLWFQSH